LVSERKPVLFRQIAASRCIINETQGPRYATG
jgi:hypothetical protein